MKKTNIYQAIREQLLMLIEYINILELKKNIDQRNEIILLIEMINNIKRHTEIYLNYTFLKTGQEDDRGTTL